MRRAFVSIVAVLPLHTKQDRLPVHEVGIVRNVLCALRLWLIIHSMLSGILENLLLFEPMGE